MPSTQVERAIRRLHAAGHRQVDIAQEMSYSQSTVSRVIGQDQVSKMSNQKVVVPELHRQPMTVVSSDWRLKIRCRRSGLGLRNGRAW